MGTVTKGNNIKTLKLILFAVITECVVLFDIFSGFLGNLLFPTSSVLERICGLVINYIFWAAGIILIYKFYKKDKSIYAENNEKPDKKGVIYTLMLLAVTVIISLISWGGPKVYKELMFGINNAGIGTGTANFIGQYIYYFLETVLMVMILTFTQNAGERIFKNKKIPYGAVGLAVLWGLVHIIFHGPLDGLITTFNALLYGCAFLALKKNRKYSLFFVYLMFVL